MRIDGELVYLTPITYDDCEDFVRWRNSEVVRSRYIYRGIFTVEGQKEWIRNKVDTGKVAQFIIWDKADNKKIGCVYFQDIDYDNRKCEYGIMIGEEKYLGGGRGSETAKLAIEYAFADMKMHRIYLRVLADNPRAIKSYENAGFVQDGYFKHDVWIDGRPEDVVFMSIIKED